MDITATIVLGGAVNAVMLAIASAVNRRKHVSASWLCLLLALLSVAAVTILVQHRLDGLSERIAVTLEHVAAYASAPTVYLYVSAALGRPPSGKRAAAHYIPLAIFLIFGAPLTLLGLAEAPPFLVTIGYMAAYTIASLLLFAANWREQGLRPQLAWPAAILATMTAVHAGQLVRLTSDSPALQDVVALAGAVAVFGLLALALAGLLPWVVAASNRYRRSSASDEDVDRAFEQLKLRLEEERLYARPDLRLADLAGAAGMSPHQASQALSQGGRVTFHELVAQYRVAAARRLLTEPENARVAVEPLGMMAGFRSRSSFYEAFQKQLGMTPAEYRRRNQDEQSCPAQPARTGKR